ncbi:DUF1853 family protein [uncultured Vibrio sp.]|uniref:DUF1853 family protein n=1 Tax=uncultured Vibrio sp. TaxID=114054 RepID=UPI00091849F5|nr:DUF1853 family protein [uncultured Vibrio sp.]OIQ26090.1 MAG: type II citrate synthase [Vibrio sp. MedPE-SWchi]
MNQLQRFYQWIASTPSLFQPQPPFVDFIDVDAPPLPATEIYEGNRRLGFLYQHLCTKLIDNIPRYQVELEEIQLNTPSGKTLGAIDFILHNNDTGRHEHWEVAVKFYLLHQGVWYGPNAHDQLDKKLDRMLTHQLKMSATKEFTQHHSDYGELSEHLLIQGRLYINPFSPEPTPTKCLGFELNPSQIAGYWCYQSQWELIEEPLYRMEKSCWATGLTQFEHIQERPTDRFIHAQTKDGKFWFVVPDKWPC